jgi:hypothetical protein
VTKRSSASVELGIVLPLGVVANQLMKIEADLRFLNMRAQDHARDGGHEALAGDIAGHLELITESLDRIRELVADLQTDSRPTLPAPRGPSREPELRKPAPEQDD